MKIKLFLMCCFILGIVCKNTFSQVPSIQWQKSYGGSNADIAYSICKSSNKGFMIAGKSKSIDGNVSNHHNVNPDTDDFWVIEIDSSGNLLWNKSYGGNDTDVPSSIQLTFDKGYIVTGYTTSNDGDVSGLHIYHSDYWVMKIDSNGILEWQKCLGGYADDEATKIIQTPDSGYFVVGTAVSLDGQVIGSHGNWDIWAVKLNSSGGIQWSKCYGGGFYEMLGKCILTRDNGFILAAASSSDDGDVIGQHNLYTSDFWVLKIDSVGNILWNKCYGGTSNDNPYEIMESSDGGYFIAGVTASSDGDVSNFIGGSDFWLIKIDSVGKLEWNRCYGGANYEEAFTACLTSDGGVAMAGVTNIDGGMVSGTHGYLDMWVVKTDSLGNFLWGKAIGGSNEERAYSITESSDGGLIVVGFSNSTDKDIALPHGDKDYWVVKLAPLGLSVPEVENSFMELTIFQNNDLLNLRFFSKHNQSAQLFLYDVTGKKVFEKSILVNEGINYNTIRIAGIAGGMYFVKIEAGKGELGGRIVIE